ncbi:MAG: hypothetical protein R2911_16900 [Caldilineaceae bacterium]
MVRCPAPPGRHGQIARFEFQRLQAGRLGGAIRLVFQASWECRRRAEWGVLTGLSGL